MGADLIFIAGLPRSGTTLLHFLLGALDGPRRHIPVGEAFGLLAPGSGQLARAYEIGCSCGARADACALWGPVVAQLREMPGANASQRYGVFLSSFQARFGAGAVPVDSSKTMAALCALMGTGTARPQVLFAIRDVRAWTVSLARRPVAGGLVKRLTSTPTALFLRWHRRNLRCMTRLRASGVDWLTVSYEELALRPEASMERIAGFLGCEGRGGARCFGDFEHHSILVNRMGADARKMGRVLYDYRWLYRTADWLTPMLLLPHVARFNRDHVYGHVANEFDESAFRAGAAALCGDRKPSPG